MRGRGDPGFDQTRRPLIWIIHQTPRWAAGSGKKAACCGFLSPSRGWFRLCRGAAIDPRSRVFRTRSRNHALSGFGQPHG